MIRSRATVKPVTNPAATCARLWLPNQRRALPSSPVNRMKISKRGYSWPKPAVCKAHRRASSPPIEIMWRLIFQKGVMIKPINAQPMAATRKRRIRKAVMTSESIIRQLIYPSSTINMGINRCRGSISRKSGIRWNIRSMPIQKAGIPHVLSARTAKKNHLIFMGIDAIKVLPNSKMIPAHMGIVSGCKIMDMHRLSRFNVCSVGVVGGVSVWGIACICSICSYQICFRRRATGIPNISRYLATVRRAI